MEGAIIQSLSHGFVASALFLIIGIVYDGRQMHILFCFSNVNLYNSFSWLSEKIKSLSILLNYMIFSIVTFFIRWDWQFPLTFLRVGISLFYLFWLSKISVDLSYFIVSTVIVRLKTSSWNLCNFFKKGCEFEYALSFRNFSSERKSEGRVVTESCKSIRYLLCHQGSKYLVLPESASKVFQAEFSHAKNLWNSFKNKISKVSIGMWQVFTFQNFYAMFINLNYVLNVQISKGYNRDNLYNLLSDPCYLVYCYFLLKRGVTNNSYSIFMEHVTLSAILCVSWKCYSY